MFQVNQIRIIAGILAVGGIALLNLYFAALLMGAVR